MNNTYEHIFPESEGLSKVQINNKYGFINSKGDLVIKCIYDGATQFKNGLSRVEKDNSYGLINKKGEYIAECKYHFIGNFNDYIDRNKNCLARITTDSNIGLIDTNGKEFLFKKGKFLDLTESYLLYCRYDNSYLYKLDNFIGNKKEFVSMIEDKFGYNDKVIDLFLYIEDIESK